MKCKDRTTISYSQALVDSLRTNKSTLCCIDLSGKGELLKELLLCKKGASILESSYNGKNKLLFHRLINKSRNPSHGNPFSDVKLALQESLSDYIIFIHRRPQSGNFYELVYGNRRDLFTIHSNSNYSEEKSYSELVLRGFELLLCLTSSTSEFSHIDEKSTLFGTNPLIYSD